MNTNNEDLLIQSFHALGMRKEAAIAAFSMINTDKQAEMMFDWIYKHHQENPTEDEILEIAERIREVMQDFSNPRTLAVHKITVSD